MDHLHDSEKRIRRAMRPVAVTLGVMASLLVLWAVLTWIYFVRTNHHLIHNEHQLLGVFSGLLGSYRFSLAQTPPFAVLQALIAASMTIGFGVMILRALDLRLPWFAELTLAWPVGFGVSGIAFELLTMARLLYPVTAWILWFAMLGGAWWAMRWRHGRPPWSSLFRETPSSAVRQIWVEGLTSWSEPKFKPFSFEKSFWWIAIVLVVLINCAIFWHAVFFPETYWDSLILYLGYGRMTFLQHAFPFKAEAQVGIGLGANYPHLFSTYGAVSSTLFNSWSDLHQRLAAPLAGVASCALVYFTTREIWGSHSIAAATMLLFRSVPNGIAYNTWASDYAFAILFCIAFVYALAILMKTRLPGAFVVYTLIPAIGMHLNYLMGILWVPWLFGVLLYIRRTNIGKSFFKGLRHVFTMRFFWAVFLVCIALSSTWYIRNWVLTGNPVYSFFPEIFTKSTRMNTEVLRSAELEWFRNGDGIGKLAERYYDIDNDLGEFRDFEDDDFQRQATLKHRLQASFNFWNGFEVAFRRNDGPIIAGSWIGRIKHLLKVWDSDTEPEEGEEILFYGKQSWKMNPLLAGFFFPAIIALLYFPMISREEFGEYNKTRDVRIVVLWTSGLLCLLLLAYMYLLADFYLYQIIGILGPAAVVSSGLLACCHYQSKLGKVLFPTLLVVVLLQGILPGLAFALMNFKLTHPQVLYGQLYAPSNLDAFRQPGMESEVFLRLQFGDDYDIWEYVNDELGEVKLLTHENRHYVFDPEVSLVHLDDWDIQQAWGLPTEEVVEYLLERDIHYYLRTPNEFRHKINARLGMEGIRRAGLLEPVLSSGDNHLYRIVSPEETPPTPNPGELKR